MVDNQLYSVIRKYKLLSSSQYGFRRGKSTSLVVMVIVRLLYDKLNAVETVITFSLDVFETFDCLEHSYLMSKPFQYDLRRIRLERFKSYISDRKQQVSVKTVNQTILSKSHGVPKGSIFGSLLFLIYIKHFLHSHLLLKFNLFPDASTITCSFRDFNKKIFQNMLNEESCKVNNWLKSNKFKVNHKKNNSMIFSYRKKALSVTNKIWHRFNKT